MRPIVFGIDISDRSIEIVSLLQRKGQLGIAYAGRRELPAGIIERGVIQDADTLTKILVGFFDALFGERRGKLLAGASLPATAVFSKSFVMPVGLDIEQLRKAVAIEAADEFPIPMQDVTDDIVVAPRAGEGPQDVFYAVASRDVVKAYRSVLVRAGAQVLFLDGEDFAIARGVGAGRPAEPVLTVDIGNRTTLLVVTDRNGIRMSSSVAFGAERLVMALEKKLKIGYAEAEKRMRAEGFDPGAGDGRCFSVLQMPAKDLIDEISKTVRYAERRFGPKVRGVLLTGGASLIPGIVDYLASNFQGLAVGRGDPFRGIATQGAGKEADPRLANLFGAAVGLARRAIGAGESPGINLIPNQARDGNGPFAGVNRFLGAITTTLSMVTHGKKSHPKKKRADAEERPAKPDAAAEPVVAEELPVELAAVAAAEPVAEPTEEAAPQQTVPAAVDMTPPELVQQAAPAAPQPAEKAPEAPEEPDFGLGIGDILREEDEIKTQQVSSKETSAADAKDDEGKLSIEDILNRGAAPSPIVKAPKRRPVTPVRPPRDFSGIGKTAVLVILVLLFFGAAAAGVYMLIKKNGLPKFPAKKPAAVAPAPAPAAAPSVTEAPASVSLTVRVGSTAKPSGDKPFVLSRIIETDVKGSDTFPATGTSSTSGGKATGKATIVNTTSRPYTFVATTRLLSKDGVLFRMKSSSPIPANGPVTVDVYADQPGAGGDIGPTTFTIPGLPPDLQKLITAKSGAAMTGGAGKAAAVSGADIASAKTKLAQKLAKDAHDNFGAMLADGEKLNPDLVTSKEMASSWPKSGTPGATFTAGLTLRFRALLLPEKGLSPLLANAMTGALPTGANAADYSLGAPLYTVQAYDEVAETAEVRIEAPIIKR